MTKWLKRALIAVPVVIILVYAAIFVYTEWLNDPADPLTVADARELASATDPPSPTAPGAVSSPNTTAPATTSAPRATSREGSGTGAAATDGVWSVGAGSEFGYRVAEVLGGVDTEAVGRGHDIAGTLTIDGSRVTEASFAVQVATIASDNTMRDGQFRGRVMNTEEFPEASFRLTRPIELVAIPPVDGEVTASVTGDLTLRGVSRSVTFDVTAVRGARRIAVVGSIPVVFADYDIDNPSNGAVTTDERGLLEFNLGFERG